MSKNAAVRFPVLSGLGRLARDRSVREGLFVFALTRGVILVIFLLTPHLSLSTEGKRFGEDPLDPDISLEGVAVGRRLRQTLNLADASWYISIARRGYERQPFDSSVQHRWAFFPLFPMVLRAASKVTGEFVFTGALLSNLFFLLALVLLHKFTLASGHGEAAADRAVFYLAAFPVSYFFSVPFTESLFLLLTVCSFYAARRGWWWAAGAAGALASATRVSGILLLPALLLMYWLRYGRRPRADVFGLLLIPAGLLAFMYFLWQITGNPFAFKDAHAAWGRETGFFLAPLAEYLTNPAVILRPWNFRLLNFAAALLAFACVYLLARMREWPMAAYALPSILLPLSSSSLQSVARFVAVIFPVFIALAVRGASPRVEQTVRAIFVVLFALMTALFAARVTTALA